MFFTVQKISENMQITPEGFLVCYNAPIARTGVLIYAPGQVLVPAGPDGRIVVTRSAEELFSETTMRSFEAKPVTDEHPNSASGLITIESWKDYAVGTVQNVRRGEGSKSNLLIADLVITSSKLFDDILNGRREVSCGYICKHVVTGMGRAYQTNIVGNHVAVVRRGRCGPQCAIQDKGITMRKKLDEDTRKRLLAARDDEGKLAEELDKIELITDNAPTSPEGNNINIQVGSSSTHDAFDSRITSLESRVNQVVDSITALDSKLSKMLDSMEEEDKDKKEVKDVDEDEEDKKDKVTDSASLLTEYSKLLREVEIVSPGLAVAAFDSAAAFTETSAAMRSAKMQSLQFAHAKGGNLREIVDRLVGDRVLDKLDNSELSLVFSGVAAAISVVNDRKVLGAGATGGRTSLALESRNMLEQINKRNHEFYYGK